MPLNTYISNSQEVLIDRLAQNTSQPLSSPISPEIFITQHIGMNHWISTKLAEKQGICSNIRFLYPNAFIYDLLKKTNPDLPERSPFETDTLTWKIMKILPDCVKKETFAPLASYLSDGSEIKAFQISKKIADIFDKYIIFRPDMLKGWEKGVLTLNNKEEKWQAELWQQLIKDIGPLYRAQLVDDLYHQLKNDPKTAEILPERIEIFGISVLPPFHLSFFEKVSEYRQVDLFLLNPCREYWGDILSRKEASKIIKPGADPEESHLFQANPLFSSLGKSGREFFDLLTEKNYHNEPLFENIEKETMLAHLQSQILDLKEQSEKIQIIEDDTSIQIHSCHSPMREIEVLHDQLLFMFENNKDLKPHDIIVMTPDINTYSPFIRAVFDSPENDNKKIPFSVSDASLLSGNSIINTFLSLIDLTRGRFGVTEVIPILESPSVRKKFSFSETDISLIKSWLKETRIRWGIDKEDKTRLGLPPFPQNTWQTGLDRLLLGYAMPGQNRDMFSGILPFDEIEGSSAQTLGRLIKFTEAIFSISKELSHSKDLKQWSSALIEILKIFFEPDDENRQKMRSLTEAVLELEKIQTLSGFNNKLTLETIREHLKTLLNQKSSSSGFMIGSVSFCAMESSRSIPAKIICLIGMNDGTFPRLSYEPGFNLISAKPQACDPSSKNEDRYLFLETLMSASEKLYISYIGQDVKDNSIIPPSVIVSELMDCLEETFILPEKDLREHLLKKHLLQPFNPEYFIKKSPLFSYSAENLKCAETLSKNENNDFIFMENPLPAPQEDFKTVSIKDLSNFFNNPCKYLLQKRLNLSLEIQEESFEDRESFSLDGLERYLVDQALLNGLSSGLNREDLFKLAEAGGMLPHGIFGESIYQTAFNNVSEFVTSLKKLTTDEEALSLPLDINIGDFRLIGNINSIYRSRLVKHRFAKIIPKDIISLWIEHLALKESKIIENDCSILAGLNKERIFEAQEFRMTEPSAAFLKEILDFYYIGLTRPIPFFPKASLAYAEKICAEKDKQTALQAAQNALRGNDNVQGELKDPYLKLCFNEKNCLTEEFEKIAMTIYEPLIKNSTKLKQ